MTLIGIVAINASMNIFGLLFEVMNSNRREAGNYEVDWSAFVYGCFDGVVPWGILLSIIFLSIDLSYMPTFAWFLMFTYLFFFNTFPINMYLQYTQVGPWSDANYPDMKNGGYYFGEKVYQVLSLVAKSVLIWGVVGGTLKYPIVDDIVPQAAL